MVCYNHFDMDKDCVFCKIVRGEIPCYKIYEDGDFLAFLDIKPLTKGNFLAIPKKHYRWTFDVPNFGEYFEFAKKVGLLVQKALNSESVSFLTLGFDVPHAHIRVFPRYENDLQRKVIDTKRYEKYTDEQMQEIAEKIKEIL